MRLTKHHGLGNDFLVLLDPAGLAPGHRRTRSQPACDRHRGVGADGLIRVTAGEGGARPHDAPLQRRRRPSRDERQRDRAAWCRPRSSPASSRRPDVSVRTDAGRAPRGHRADGATASHRVTTDMGPAKVGEDEPEWLDDDIIRAVRVDIGNPHLVLHAADPDWDDDLVALGRAINESTPGGINVEVITPGPGDDELTMRVYERGVGITEACGTGACAAAAAAVAWELTGPDVVVHQPGGDARVTVGETTTLRGRGPPHRHHRLPVAVTHRENRRRPSGKDAAPWR